MAIKNIDFFFTLTDSFLNKILSCFIVILNLVSLRVFYVFLIFILIVSFILFYCYWFNFYITSLLYIVVSKIFFYLICVILLFLSFFLLKDSVLLTIVNCADEYKDVPIEDFLLEGNGFANVEFIEQPIIPEVQEVLTPVVVVDNHLIGGYRNLPERLTLNQQDLIDLLQHRLGRAEDLPPTYDESSSLRNVRTIYTVNEARVLLVGG